MESTLSTSQTIYQACRFRESLTALHLPRKDEVSKFQGVESEGRDRLLLLASQLTPNAALSIFEKRCANARNASAGNIVPDVPKPRFDMLHELELLKRF